MKRKKRSHFEAQQFMTMTAVTLELNNLNYIRFSFLHVHCPPSHVRHTQEVDNFACAVTQS